MKILIIGNGYIGRRCAESWPEAELSAKKINSSEDVLDLIDQYRPDAVLNAAGVRGRPNVDWCEAHQMQTIEGNTILPLLIAKACNQRGVYLLHIGSGCVFYGDSPYEDKKWRENDYANPVAVYSRSKWAADLVLSTLPGVGIGRIRMPIDHIPSEANMIDKLAGFDKVVDVENSVTVIQDMIGVFYQLMQKRVDGIFHVTNPGVLRHREIIDLYKKYVDSDLQIEWVDETQLVKQGMAKKKRSNNLLRSDSLRRLGIQMREVHLALEDVMRKYSRLKNDADNSDA